MATSPPLTASLPAPPLRPLTRLVTTGSWKPEMRRFRFARKLCFLHHYDICLGVEEPLLKFR